MRSPAGENFAPLGLMAGRDRVWVIGAQGALRIDPATNARDRFVAYEQSRGTVAEGERVWMLLTDGRLREIDARTGRRVRDVQLRVPEDSRILPGPPGFLTLSDTTSLTEIDRNSGAVLWKTEPGDVVRASGFFGDSVWVHVSREPDGPDRLIRLDPDTGRRLGEVTLADTDALALATVRGDVWVADPGGTIMVVR